MNDLAFVLATVVPALTVGASGVALHRAATRVAASLMLTSATGVIVAAVIAVLSDRSLVAYVLVASVAVPGALAVVAYPRAGFAHPVEFCTWVVVAAAGVIATIGAREPSVWSAMGMTSVLALTGHLWWEFERGDERDRLAVLWLTVAALTAGSIFGLLFLSLDGGGVVPGALVLSVIGPAMVVGARRPHLADVRALIVEVVVVGVVVLTYVALFVGLVVALDLAGVRGRSDGRFALVGAIVAVGFHPLRVVLRGVIDELLFGDRPDPLTAATRVADRIGDDPVLALRAIREALVLPYASLSAGSVELATSGTPVTFTRRLPLSLGGDLVGEIVVGLRPGDMTLSAGDERVLRIVAPLLAQTLRARALADDLQVSRRAAIAAISEERLRLRRDLHDGLGPTLSGIAFASDAARNTLRDDPDGADELVRGIRRDAVAAIGEIRRLVYGMRPPALDELGLVPAIRQRVASVQTAAGRPMRVSVGAPSGLHGLPAAVEVAAFRIVTEAVTNAARHSGTDEAWVTLEVGGDRLTLTVRDRGGGSEPWVPGVGMAAMRERATEVGGTFAVERDDHGSRIRACLPIG